jgi:hypothetical protein
MTKQPSVETKIQDIVVRFIGKDKFDGVDQLVGSLLYTDISALLSTQQAQMRDKIKELNGYSFTDGFGTTGERILKSDVLNILEEK